MKTDDAAREAPPWVRRERLRLSEAARLRRRLLETKYAFIRVHAVGCSPGAIFDTREVAHYCEHYSLAQMKPFSDVLDALDELDTQPHDEGDRQ